MKPKKERLATDGNADKPIPADIYPVIDTDLARDNLENDLPEADRQDLSRSQPNSKNADGGI